MKILKVVSTLLLLLLLNGCTTVTATKGDMSISRTAFGINLELSKIDIAQQDDGSFSFSLEGIKSDSAQAIESAVTGAVKGLAQAK